MKGHDTDSNFARRTWRLISVGAWPTPAPCADEHRDTDSQALGELLDASAFVMPIFGTVAVDGHRFDRDDLKLSVFATQAVSHAITLQAPQGGAKVMLFSGRPLR